MCACAITFQLASTLPSSTNHAPLQALGTQLPAPQLQAMDPFTTLGPSATHIFVSSVCWWAIQNVSVFFSLSVFSRVPLLFGRSGVRFPAGKRFLSLPKRVRTNKPPIQWVQGVKRPGHEGDCSPSTQIRSFNCPGWPLVLQKEVWITAISVCRKPKVELLIGR